MAFLHKLILGSHPTDRKMPRGAYANQWLNLRRIWNNDACNDFGIERIFRLFLITGQFLLPGLFARSIGGRRHSDLEAKLGIEVYVVVKLLFLAAVLAFHWYESSMMLYLITWLLLDTLLYLSGLVFLPDTHIEPISFRRSVILLLINYIEVCLSFAILYMNSQCLDKPIPSPIAAVYFSVVTSATVGYGDFHPNNDLGYFLAICQIMVSLIFVVIFLNFFSSRIQDDYAKQGRGKNVA